MSFSFVPRLAAPALAAVFLLAPLQTVMAQGGEKPPLKRSMTLSATGSIDSRPDMASIRTGVETEAVKAADALEDNTEIMTRMLASLKQAGLEDRDIATTQFSVQPRYQHFKTGRAPRIIGYRVSNSVHITVRKLNELGTILDRLVTLGSNRISNIQFGISNPDNALDEARGEAMRKVLAKARLYAKAAGVNLGVITSIREQARSPRPLAYRASRKRSAAPVPIAPGQHKTSVTVHVTWSLVD